MQASYYPRSFLKLLVIGFSLVALPLLVALASSALSVNRLADQSRRAVHQAAEAAHASRMLLDQLTTMERSLRQYAVLGDAALLDGYRLAQGRFSGALDQLATLPLGDEDQALLAELSTTARDLHAALVPLPPERPALEAAIARFPALNAAAGAMVARRDDIINREVDTLSQLADEAQRLVGWQLAALVPVAVLLVVGFTALIARPIRQIDAAIRRIGEGRLAQAVEVDGPEDLRYLGGRLDWMRARLAELEEQKTRFLRHLSHEIKTPLTAVREGAELLTEGAAGELAPPQRQLVDILRDNSVRLQRRIEDLLDYAALSAQNSRLSLAPVDLAAIVARVAEAQRLALESRRLTVAADCAGVSIEADAEKLATIVDNLLSNAIKFSPPGGTIRVSAVRGDDALVLEVEDEGPGVPAAERASIFQPFVQGSTRADGPVQGTGLGLSIVAEYARMHGGSAEVVAGSRGARFRVTLPPARVELPA